MTGGLFGHISFKVFVFFIDEGVFTKFQKPVVMVIECRL